jgi:hypothetical protein
MCCTGTFWDFPTHHPVQFFRVSTWQCQSRYIPMYARRIMRVSDRGLTYQECHQVQFVGRKWKFMEDLIISHTRGRTLWSDQMRMDLNREKIPNFRPVPVYHESLQEDKIPINLCCFSSFLLRLCQYFL